ncbi:MAG: WS/DGAT domain-containing protein, partial [Mycobacteriaceae bacterium]
RFTSLPTNIADPVECLETISADNKATKEHYQSISAKILQDWAQFAAPAMFGLAMRTYAALRLAERHRVVHNLVISNVPGPPVPIYFLGAEVLAMYPLGPVFHGAGLNITVLSNNGHLDIGIIACLEQVPHPWSLADEMPNVVAQLLAEARQRTGTKAPAKPRARKTPARKTPAPKTPAPKNSAESSSRKAAGNRSAGSE